MTKRGYIRLFSYACALVVVLGGYSIKNMNEANDYKARLETTYQQSLTELAENLDSIETNLTKSVYSNSDKMLLEISRDLFSECTNAKEALSRLPVGQMNLSSTYKFISQASDYAAYIAQKAASGKNISDEEHKNLAVLLNYAKTLKQSVDSMVSICNGGAQITSNRVQGSNIQISSLKTDLTVTEDNFKDYPTLLYDGPFADAVLNREAQMIKNSKKVTADEARKLASNALSCNMSEISLENEDEGKIPAYVFTYGQKTIGITKNGGYPLYILYGGKINNASITEKEAVNAAEKYLGKLGFKNMSNTYYMSANNICVINFAYKKDGITYYSDLIKVGISLENGKPVSLEAEGYLVNHRQRKIADEAISKKEAQDKLSKYLKVISSKKCIIPKEDGTEAYCYEFRCESSETNEEVLIYINCSTGKEEDIMLLLYSDGGTLTK